MFYSLHVNLTNIEAVKTKMKILLGTHGFSPMVGGIESCSLSLAKEFVKKGNEVRVLTQTPSQKTNHDHGLNVIRNPTKCQLFDAIGWAEIFFQNNISLQTAWPLVFKRRPWVVCSATWIGDPDLQDGFFSKFKRSTLRWATNIYISKAVQTHVGFPGQIIPYPYDPETFRCIPEIQRKRSIVFLGRLVKDKGCEDLLRSISILKEDHNLILPLVVIGSGPEAGTLRKLASKLNLDVDFTGVLVGEKLAKELNRHEIMVVPSRWKEPFGLVVLEGMACGCKILGSDGGGLPDALGACGLTFKRGDLTDLARGIRAVLDFKTDQKVVSIHLMRHQVEAVAEEYLKVFKKALQRDVS